MNTKEKLLTLFESKLGEFISGEEIAETLNISRTAVWKNVKALRECGYEIDAVTNKGYSLSKTTDKITESGIREKLSEENKDLRLSVFDTVTSTNAILRKMANEGEVEGRVVLSEEQTAGRGRYTRKFYSPKGTGVYMSLLLRPKKMTAEESTRITTMAGVAMCEAIEENSSCKPKIKWVNDIFIDGKKVSGILTEASFDMESGSLDYAVLGIGVNIYEPSGGFSEEIKDIATCIYKEPVANAKNSLIASFLNRFFRYYREENFKVYTDKYKEYSFVIGKKVILSSNGVERGAEILSIDDSCRLVVRLDNGEQQVISYGEIAVIF